jgi:2-polyprenyl-3-methyl-5-hydroxy-6-metoxy-1,4-benzoquinol methylase
LDPRYGERYRELYDRHWWWRARTELVERKIRQLCQPGEKQSILDVGCGDALFFDRLQKFGDVEGVEPFAGLVNPNNPHRARIHMCPFDQKFQPGKLYSLILMLDVLEHLPDPVAALRHVLSLLRPGGLFMLTVPSLMSLWTNHDVINHHLVRYTKKSFREVAARAGFAIQEETYLYYWTCPVKMCVGFAERVLRLQPKPPGVPPAWINEPLYWLSRLEQKLLTPLSMPFGSSLMVVGSRAS